MFGASSELASVIEFGFKPKSVVTRWKISLARNKYSVYQSNLFYTGTEPMLDLVSFLWIKSRGSGTEAPSRVQGQSAGRGFGWRTFYKSSRSWSNLTTNLSLSLTVKEFWKWIVIWLSYRDKFGGLLFWNAVYFVRNLQVYSWNLCYIFFLQNLMS